MKLYEMKMSTSIVAVVAVLKRYILVRTVNQTTILTEKTMFRDTSSI